MSNKFLRNDGTFQQVDMASLLPGLTSLTAATTANLRMTGGYVDGPTVSQGSSGTWFATGTVSFVSSAVSFLAVKIWDGTTVMGSAESFMSGNDLSVSVSGILANPAGNLRISALASTAVQMVFNDSGAGKDSNISAVRIG